MTNPDMAADIQTLKDQVSTMVQTLATLSLNQGRNSGGVNIMVRSPTIKFPTFDGTDVEDWLFKCTQFFSITDVDNVAKVTYTTMHLEAKALAWHQAFTKNRKKLEPLGWEEYMDAIKARFGNAYEDPMSELLDLKQSSDVQSYHDAFDILISKLDLQPDYALSFFLSGPYNAEMEEKKAKGLCFYCDERFTPQHVCKNKRQLFVLEEDIEDDKVDEIKPGVEEAEPQIAQISLLALAVRSHCQTVRIPG
ncbi:uncharacterized protein LOC141632631 [Silene latifolia]|uniref:uncharacterized protein LOC141632631 n=1 Tax=Silene latifolia TaxID=37657 RepID=UPI003D77279B